MCPMKKLLLLRLAQINGSYPKKNGIHIEYYKNGGLKAKGKFKGKVMHGFWEFYRIDGEALMEEVVKKAAQLAEPGDTVLLAPACASMDQFANYADRGDKFAAAAKKLA